MLQKFINHYNYSVDNLKKDVIAGITVGIVALPLAMAFAIASGVRPEYGIYSTIIAGIIVGVFGGSKFQIAGPTGAFIPILFGIVAVYGYENLLIAGFMAGVFLTLMGMFRLGSLIKFIPRPVTIGFTAGIAVVIFWGQVPNILGLDDIVTHNYFHQNVVEVFNNLYAVNFYSFSLTVFSLLILIITPKINRKIPGSLIAIIVATVLSSYVIPGKVSTIGTLFGNIPQQLPVFSLLSFSFDKITTLIGPALAIAFLGSIESLLSCVVADGMTNQKHHSNRELIGQGLANMITPFFGGIPVTGAIARTATNIKSGAVSRFSSVVHSLTVVLILLLFAPKASQIPLACMAAILTLVAWNMSQKHSFIEILKTTKSDGIVLAITFMLTIFVDLIVAVQFGFIAAVILFVKRMSEVMRVERVLPDKKANGRVTSNGIYKGNDCDQINIFSIDGALFFGVADLFEEYIINSIGLRPKVLILDLEKVPMLDATAELNFTNVVNNAYRHNTTILITEIQEQPLNVIKNSGLFDKIGAENFYTHTGHAITKALTLVNPAECATCINNAFYECAQIKMNKKKISLSQ